jgi:hypothetical protein
MNDLRIHHLAFSGESMSVAFSDERSVAVSLSYFPRLRAASLAEREQWQLIGRGLPSFRSSTSQRTCPGSCTAPGEVQLHIQARSEVELRNEGARHFGGENEIESSLKERIESPHDHAHCH